ncbi:MAG: hypothetical protein OXM61_01495 [Candidatus Poribacteria bacterium]|nr:hypothetical protein [Candidatus Poribacteria bacterium]
MKILRPIALCIIGLMLLCPAFAKVPTKAKIAFVSEKDNSWGIDMMNPDGSDRVNLIQHQGGVNQLAWSPDGKQILFGTRNDKGTHDIFIMDADGANAKPLFKAQNYKREPAWSPDGKQIAYMAYSKISGAWHIHIASTDEQSVEPTIPVGRLGGAPAWSPDGTEIAFVKAACQKREIYIYNLETNAQEKLLSENPPSMLYPAWSPDGKKIAFYWSRIGQQKGIYTVNRDGTDLQQVTETGARVLSLTWSPSGDELLYAQTANDFYQLFKVDLRTVEIEQLTHEGHNSDAVWFDPSPSSLSVSPSESLLTTTWGKVKNSD